MTKSLSNELLKNQLYSLRMTEETPVLQHLNVFNWILSNLLALEVKLEEEDKALLLLLFLHDHLATTMYEKEILELEDVRHIPQNKLNEENRFHKGDLRISSQRGKREI